MKPLFPIVGVALLSAVVSVTAGSGQRIDRQLLGVGPTADTFFADTTLHEVRLTINTRDWETLQENFLSNAYYPCDFSWRGIVVRNVGIRSRGTGSRSGIKPGLRVDFDRYTTDQKFLNLKSFVLRNNTQDPSNMHERLSFQLFRRLGFPASREAHARLYVNTAYAGLYTIVESVDKAFLQHTYNEDNGYLFDYDYPATAAPYYFEDRGSNPTAYVPLPFKPETNESDPKPEFIVQLVQAINIGAAFRSAVAPFLDLARFVRHVAVEVFLADTDGFIGDYGMNNFFLYRFQNSTMFTLIPWDKSEAFKGGSAYYIFHNQFDIEPARRNRLFSNAINQSDLFNLYLDTMLEAARVVEEPEAGATGGWLEREIQRTYDQIRAAALEDPVKPYSNAEFEQAVADLRAFAQQRGPAVRQQVAIARGEPALQRRPRLR